MKPIAIYARVSTARQEEEQTIQTQIVTLKEFAIKNGYTIVKEYTDEGWSGDVLARPSLDRMRQDVKEKNWQAVLIYDPDRLARRYSYQELVMDELRDKGIEVIFVTVAAPKNSEDKILHGVRGLFAEYERAKITERFRLGKVRKAKEGHLLGGRPLYGYNYIPKNDKVHGYYSINESEARVVRLMFSWVADEQLTIRKVIKRLYELGLKPPRSKRGVWCTSTLGTLLRHKGYIGEAHWGKRYGTIPENPINKNKYKKMKKSSAKVRPEEEWIKIPIPAIIDKELFERAGQALNTNFFLSSRNRRYEYLFAGKIWCVCGKRRCGEGAQQGKYLHYRCVDRIHSFPFPHSCREPGINAKLVDKLIWEKIITEMSSPKLMQEQISKWVNKRQNKTEFIVTDTDSMEKEIAQLKTQEERYTKAYGTGLFTLEQLAIHIDPIRNKIEALRSTINKNKIANSRNDMLFPDKLAVESFALKVVRTIPNLNFDTKRAIVRNTIEKVIANKLTLRVYGSINVNQDIGLCPSHNYDLNANGYINVNQDIELCPSRIYDLNANGYINVNQDIGLCPSRKYDLNANQHSDRPEMQELIPFEFNIPLISKR